VPGQHRRELAVERGVRDIPVTPPFDAVALTWTNSEPGARRPGIRRLPAAEDWIIRHASDCSYS